MEGRCSTGQSPHRAVVPVEEEVGINNEEVFDVGLLHMFLPLI
jgi:hypothetical protein